MLDLSQVQHKNCMELWSGQLVEGSLEEHLPTTLVLQEGLQQKEAGGPLLHRQAVGAGLV